MAVSKNRKEHKKKVAAYRNKIKLAADKNKKRLEDMIAQMRKKVLETTSEEEE